jgi:hypothetical protein
MMSVGVLKHIFQCVVVWVCGQAALVLNFGCETHARDRIFGWLSIYSEVAQGAMNICAYHTMCFSMPCESRGVLLHFLVINRSYFSQKQICRDCLLDFERKRCVQSYHSKQGFKVLGVAKRQWRAAPSVRVRLCGFVCFFVGCNFHFEITWVMHRGVW